MMTSRIGRGATQEEAETQLVERMRVLYVEYLHIEPIADAWELVRRAHDVSFGKGGSVVHTITQWVRV